MTMTTRTPLQFDMRNPRIRDNAFAIYREIQEREPLARAVLTMSDLDADDFSGSLGRGLGC